MVQISQKRRRGRCADEMTTNGERTLNPRRTGHTPGRGKGTHTHTLKPGHSHKLGPRRFGGGGGGGGGGCGGGGGGGGDGSGGRGGSSSSSSSRSSGY